MAFFINEFFLHGCDAKKIFEVAEVVGNIFLVAHYGTGYFI